MANHRAKVHFYRREQFLLLPAYLRDSGVVGDLEQALGHAEAVARGLWGVARTLARYCLVPLARAERVREPRPDQPLSFSERRFAPRRVRTAFIPAPPLREELCTSPDCS